MLTRKIAGRPGAETDAQFAETAKRTIQDQAAEIASLNESQDQMFDAMLAEMDSRIEEITARTDRLLAQHR